MLQQGVPSVKIEIVSSIETLNISPKIFNYGKKINLLVGRMPPPPAFAFDVTASSPHHEKDYEKLLKDIVEDLEQIKHAHFAKLLLIGKQE